MCLFHELQKKDTELCVLHEYSCAVLFWKVEKRADKAEDDDNDDSEMVVMVVMVVST